MDEIDLSQWFKYKDELQMAGVIMRPLLVGTIL